LFFIYFIFTGATAAQVLLNCFF